ncbi:RNA-directed DNA polymerase, partial [Listeria monocytogenes serotype 1/2b]|nr:RNA-directed DNA polymerase [Listeria monocytogenes serotype 1/2b]EAG4937438.1 RNA-directed DNA polymerase [Listeria monocytogenes]HAB7692262.1 reverse transcriptase [Listeria monocytogenes]HAK1411197.1 RNA-directed DNA polymerase [Listeria monocytogenes]
MRKKVDVLSMDNEKAREFFMKPSSYFSQNLPKYFNLGYLLESAESKLGKKQLKKEMYFENKVYSNFPNVNFLIQTNKTISTYRPITLLHPYIYVDYVNFLTEIKIWEELKERFQNLQEEVKEKIICSSLPFDIETSKEDDSKKEMALNFWKSIEQETIKYSLGYNYLLKLDISNFYGSIYTHTLCWAFHGENYSKEAKNSKNLQNLTGDKCDRKFQWMNYGETVGIPQGNVISDLMSELLLAYIDSELVKKIDDEIDYKIIRYRDDYRIFTKRLEDSTLVKRELVVLLQRFKLNLGESKTSQTTDIISGSLKEDKMYWIEHDPVTKLTSDKFYRSPKILMKKSLEEHKNKKYKTRVFNEFFKKHFHNRTYQATLQKHLLIIKVFSDLYPNSGQLIAALHEFEGRLLDLNYKDFRNIGTEVEVLIAILVDIIKKNPKITEIGVKLLSTLLKKINFEEFEMKYLESNNSNEVQSDFEVKLAYINSVNHKLSNSNYNDYLEIWMQRLVVKNLKESTTLSDLYIEQSKNELVKFCNSIIRGKEMIQIFNEDWLKDE